MSAGLGLPMQRFFQRLEVIHGHQHRRRLAVPAQRTRKITVRCTTKLMTVAVPCAITNATGSAHR